MLRRILLALVFLFSVSPAFASNILIIVDLQMQTMHVRLDGVTKYRWDISSGAYGFETPPGRYEPTRMYKTYHSRQYNMAPMPYSIFFHQGYAIHGTTFIDRLGSVASHGCVRLATENAQTLFALVKKIGPDNTIIRVEPHRATVAVITDPPMSDEPMVAEAETPVAPVAQLDDVRTGSTTPATVPWLRKGLNS